RARLYSFSKDTISFEYCRPWSGIGAKSPPAVWHAGGCVVYDYLNRMFRHGANSTTLSPLTLKELVQSLDRSEPQHHHFQLFFTSGFLSNCSIDEATTLAEEVMNRVTNQLAFTYAPSELGTPLLLSRIGATK